MAQGRGIDRSSGGGRCEEERESSSRDLLSNQLPGRAAGLAASTSVSPSAPWTAYCFILCPDPRPPVRGRPASHPRRLSLVSDAQSHPRLALNVHSSRRSRHRGSYHQRSALSSAERSAAVKDKGEAREDHQDEAPRGRRGFPPAGVHRFLRGACQIGQ